MSTATKSVYLYRQSTLPLAKLIEVHSLSLRAAGHSPNTVEWYGDLLGKFAAWAGETDAEALNPDSVRAFLVWLQDDYVSVNRLTNTSKKVSSRTLQAHVQALRAFTAWLHREGYLSANPLASLPLPKARRNIIATFQPEQLKAMLAGLN